MRLFRVLLLLPRWYTPSHYDPVFCMSSRYLSDWGNNGEFPETALLDRLELDGLLGRGRGGAASDKPMPEPLNGRYRSGMGRKLRE